MTGKLVVAVTGRLVVAVTVKLVVAVIGKLVVAVTGKLVVAWVCATMLNVLVDALRLCLGCCHPATKRVTRLCRLVSGCEGTLAIFLEGMPSNECKSFVSGLALIWTCLRTASAAAALGISPAAGPEEDSAQGF